MIRIRDISRKTFLTASAVALAVFAPFGVAYAAKLQVLYDFSGGTDGGNPVPTLVQDEHNNFYGAAQTGRLNNDGVIYKMTPNGAETVLHVFGSAGDGNTPLGLILDSSGNMYGTAYYGGGSTSCTDVNGCGAVFKLAPNGTETVLYSFNGGNEGSHPRGSLIVDQKGNLYGVTANGGGSSNCADGFGTVFKLTRNGTETILHAFTGGSDGATPIAGLIADDAGNLYGTASVGGTGSCAAGCGVIYRLSPKGKQKILYSFTGGSDGASPYASLTMDGAGNFYGTTAQGGTNNCEGGCGVVFKLSSGGRQTVLYRFTGGGDGSLPATSPIIDEVGNFYGTALGGGSSGDGVVYKLNPKGKETVLHAFTGGSDGAFLFAGVIMDAAGNLYGAAGNGGNDGCTNGCGAVFEIKN